MSAGPDPQTNVNLIEETRKQINRLFEEVARLAEMDLAPTEFYGQFLQRVLQALAAPGGAVWGRTAQGNLQLQCEINMRAVGLDRTQEGRESHDELLRRAVTQPQPRYLPPHSSEGGQNGAAGPGNPTDFIILLVPVVVDNQVAALLEVWQAPDRAPAAVRGFLEFMMRMAELATRYTRNLMLRQMVGQQQLWVQLEQFARQIHASLNPVEVSYLIANEARRLIECDRVSLGVRYGRKVKVEAISGADVVEKRSNLVQLMRVLFDKVIAWGEKLVYTGSKDDTLPPDVLKALDAYLAESNSKLLVVLPLKDEREKDKEKESKSDKKKPARSAMMMESFEPEASPEQMFARLEVIARHSAPALYNAVEHRRIPFRFVWVPLAAVQEGLGGKAKAIGALIAVAVVALIVAMILVPYPLKMDATGQLLPESRRWVYSPAEGQAVEFRVNPNDTVSSYQQLIKMYDDNLALKIRNLQGEIAAAQVEINGLNRQSTGASAAEQQRNQVDKDSKTAVMNSKKYELGELQRRLHAVLQNPGEFWINAPELPAEAKGRKGPVQWTVLSSDFKENLTTRTVKASEPLLRLGDKGGAWEIELKIPQKHIGQVLYAYQHEHKDPLDVDLLVRSEPTHVYKGKLARIKVANEAQPNKDDNNEAEPVVLAYVRLTGPDIAARDSLPQNAPELLVAGTEVHAKIRCGNHPMGYSLFYGVWEFFYEKVVFFF
ncbi:MAG TPA: hypothetical protein VJ739_15205 [Gemmataceae bacterium]|nr:hypothetical protein [Gemmataceae bacterium]